MNKILQSDLFIMTLNLGAYLFSFWFINRFKIKYITPLLLSIPIIAVVITLFSISYETYKEGSRILNFLLSPSVVAIGYLLHKNIKSIGRNIVPLIFCVAIGAVVNSVVINLCLMWFDLDPAIITSIHPKSVTTPIALSLSMKLGGISSITVISVVFAGLFGSILGVPVLNFFKVQKPIARGAALGATSHAIGTSKALELGSYEGAVAGLVIGLMGLITAILLPYMYALFL